MTKKPSYEELEKRVQELEKEVVERMQLEGTLKESGEGYRDFFNLNPDPVVIVQDKVVKLANSAYTKLFGVSQENIGNGFSLFEHLQEKDKGAVDQRYNERLSGKELQDVHRVEILSNNGKNIPCEAYSSLIQYGGRPALLAVIRDISKRKEDEEKLRVSETRYRALFEAAGDAIFLLKVLNQDLSFADFNPRVLEMFRCTRDELLGKPPLDLSPPIQPDGTPSNKKAFEKIQSALEGRPQFFEWQHRRPDGSLFDSETSLTRLSLNGEIYIQAIFRDITDRKLAEEELRKHRNHLKELVTERTKELQKINEELMAEISQRKHAADAMRENEAKYRSIFENVAVSIMLIDTDGQILDINPYHINHIARGKVQKENLLGQNLFAYPTVVAGGISEELKRVLEGKPVNILDHYFPITSGGKPTYFNSRAVPLFVDDEVTGAVIIMEDITKFKQSEIHVRDLSHQLLKTQERERQMISYELHDSVAQELSSLKITCEMLLRDKSLTQGARKQISEITGSLLKTLRGVRDLSYELRPPGLIKSGLSHTIHQSCKDFSEKTGVRVDFQTAGLDNLNLDYDIKINLYRLLQEGLNNVKKHADASNVQVRLVSSFPNIILRIDDDGKGFDLKDRLAKPSSEKRMGLSNMTHRVNLLLGRINVESVPGKGTKIIIEIPLKDKNLGS